MYPELQQFQQIEKDYEAYIQQLKDEQKQLEEKKVETSQQYNKTLSKVIYENDSDSAIKLAELKDQSNEVAEKLEETKRNIEQKRVAKKERLEHMIVSLKTGRDREFEAVDKHMEAKKEDLLRYRADYLLLIQQLYEIRQYAQDVDTSFKKTVKPLSHEFEYDSSVLPSVNLHNPFGKEEALGIMETEVQQVYNTGRLPEWVEGYASSSGNSSRVHK